MNLIRLRDQPGVAPLERQVEQHGWTEEPEERAHELSRQLFGIKDDDTRPRPDGGGVWIGGWITPDIGDLVRLKIAQWESHFEVERMLRDDADAYWASRGWDVTDGHGKSLAVMTYLVRPLVCVVKGLHSRARFANANEAGAEQRDAEARAFRLSRRV